MNVGHDGQRRSRVFFDDGQIDRFFSVDQRVAISDVGAVLNGGHVTQVNILAGPDRNLAQSWMSTTVALFETIGIVSLT